MIGLGLGNGLEGLSLVGAHCDLRDVDVAIGHGDLGKALLLGLLTGSRELSDLTDVGSLGGLSAGVGVDLGIEDEDVDILVLGKDMVHAAEADIVGPAVAAEDPDGLLAEVILLAQDLRGQLAGVTVAAVADALFEGGNVSLGGRRTAG